MWVRDRESRRRGVDGERERELQQSDLSCGEDTQERIPEAVSGKTAARERRDGTASFMYISS